MRHLTRSEIDSLAGALPELSVEERALDAVIEAYGQGTRFTFEGGRLAIRPPKDGTVAGTLTTILAESREAIRLAGALIVIAGHEDIEVASLSRLEARHRFLRVCGNAAQALATGDNTEGTV